MNKFEGFAMIMVGLFFAGAVSVMFAEDTRYLKIDCRYSEISPDISPDIKEMCRKMRAK